MTTHEIRYRVEGMDCGSCASKIETAVRRLGGVEDVKVSFQAQKMTVRSEDRIGLTNTIEKTVKALGFSLAQEAASNSSEVRSPKAIHSCCSDGHHSEETEHGHADDVNSERPMRNAWWASSKGRLTIALGLALAAAWVGGNLFPQLEPWLFIAAMLVGLIPIARRAVMAARSGTPFSIEM
ncbi:MAG TPA: cation transporter, partial [Hyphomicrobium sp.]|nr:cation transporter [Hyphomicrobium sp.]